jgi:hypothetical protein
MDNEQLFTKGFNSGYVMAEFEPDLLNKVINNVTPTAPFLEGIFSGKEQYGIEMDLNKTQLQELQNLRGRSNSRDQELGREI